LASNTRNYRQAIIAHRQKQYARHSHHASNPLLNNPQAKAIIAAMQRDPTLLAAVSKLAQLLQSKGFIDPSKVAAGQTPSKMDMIKMAFDPDVRAAMSDVAQKLEAAGVLKDMQVQGMGGNPDGSTTANDFISALLGGGSPPPPSTSELKGGKLTQETDTSSPNVDSQGQKPSLLRKFFKK
jgi:hypothetical protein